ncbi:DNA (cytosine-5-)-methyltransferase [Bacillus thuringiensis]|uniref:DNA (cytosine-5-)-methyltransferase n=1 Tax=Bacillus cereus group TaxID=86661 RepID=UPI001371A630|nr:DNA (cytosine-5-)-methyltransferase [Bacillus cereus]MED2879585.1 DNA (cytosine-5-)-methyltransferase [Bacillus thuringiensis]MCU5674211.1 DNA (cytosine-5-)-methyltransferase [Bacillus cereus]MDA2364267.1 DNA (cytosine-5-)-methyltransferase [Bacillus cereus]MDA2369454.1 DNA (cytosine-5-)-methyltransferase [Bacillus cereus]MDA2374645.1 DNA (cytosine-5-)-methyltransferase [Bacillus cereus]
MTYTVVDLLAGVGGMTKAFIEEGYKVDLAIDYDKSACEIFKDNYPDVHMIQGDIRKIPITDIPDCDILVSRLPVQSLSYIKDKRKVYNSIGVYLTEVLATKHPKVVLLESVKPLLMHNKGETFNSIIEGLKDLGYKTVYKVLNAKDYANLPFDREKLYIVGFTDEFSFNSFSFPDVLPLEKSLLEIIDVRKEKEGAYYYGQNSNGYHLLDETVTEKYSIYFRGFNKENIKFKGNKDICPPLFGMPKNYFIRDDYGIRNLTIQEYMEISGLNKYKIPDNIGNYTVFRLVSNSSIPPLIRRIAQKIKYAVGKNYGIEQNTLVNQRVQEKNKVYLEECLRDDRVENQEKFINGKGEVKNSKSGLKTLIRNVENAVDNNEKGKALEILIKEFFEQVKGFKVSTNKRTRTEEIDIQIRNESNSTFWSKETILFIGECKNWSKKVGKNELVIFKNKIENRRGRVGVGFFVSWNGFSTTFTNEVLRTSKEEIVIIPVDGNQIKEAIDNGNIEEYIKVWYTEAVMS